MRSRTANSVSPKSCSSGTSARSWATSCRMSSASERMTSANCRAESAAMAKPPVEKIARRINKDCSIQRFHQLYSCLPFERARPNQLWQTDLFTFMLKRQNRRVYLVAFMDDHIRFIVGYG